MEVIQAIKEANRPFISDNRRVLKGVSVGGYRLSIQGSDGHYSTPNKVVDIEAYSSMELAIFKERKSGFLRASNSSVFRAFPRWDELKRASDGFGIYGWVSIDLLNDLYNYLKNR